MDSIKKAKELVQTFIDKAYSEDCEGLYTNIAKKAALICVDEQIYFITEMISIDYNIRKIYINELEEVKQQIKKL